MRAPWAEVPLPGGSPVPSGRMLMSHAAISAGSVSFPRPGPSARTGLEASARTTTRLGNLDVDMPHLALAVHRPARDAVVVLVRETQDWRDLLGLAAHGHELGTGWLHVAGLVPRAALQYGRTAIPAPGHAEPSEGLA